MKTERLILKNTLFLIVGKGVGDVCTLFFLIYFSRSFGADILGKYAFAMAVGGLLTVLINLGLNTLLVREVSKDNSKSRKYVGNLLVTQGILAAFIWVFIGLIAFAANFSTDTTIILFLIGTYHVFYKLTMLLYSGFRAHEEMQYPAFLEFYHKLFILILGGASIVIWKNAILTLTIYPLSALSMFILGFIIYVSRYGWPELTVDYGFVKSSLVKGLPFFVTIILAQFYNSIGIIFLTYLKGEGSAGIFLAADRLVVTIGAGLAMLGAVMFPVMSRLSIDSRSDLLKLYERAFRLMIIAVLPLSTMVYILSRPIIASIFGERFVESAFVLEILCWTMLFIGMKQIMFALLVVTKHEKEWLKMVTGVCIGYTVMSLVVIPEYGSVGLAYARLVTESLLFASAYLYISRIIGGVNIIKTAGPVLISCSLAIVVFYLMGNISVWLGIPSAFIVCVSGIVIFRGIQRHDVVFMKGILWGKERLVRDGKMDSEYLENSFT